MSARESQLLLEEIERKQRCLDDISSVPLWCPSPPPPRPNRWNLVAAVIGILAAVVMICGLVLLDDSCSQAKPRTASGLRVQLKNAPNIPWRHYLGHDGPRSCDVFLSVLGMAEVECDGKTVYRGFGSVDYDGSFHSLALEEATRFDHDVTRIAYIDVRRRHAHIAGWLGTVIVDITGLQDQSLLELPEQPPPPEAPGTSTFTAR